MRSVASRLSSCSLRAALLLGAAVVPALAGATSEGPRLDGPYVGTLPCADCEGIATELVILRDPRGAPVGYRLRQTYLTTRPGDRVFNRAGDARAFTHAAGNPAATGLRLDGGADDAPMLLLQLSPSVVELLDRSGQRIDSKHGYRLVLDRAAQPPPVPAPRALFAGTLRRQPGGAGWQFLPCRTRDLRVAIDVSPENSLTAVLTDLGFDRRDSLYVEAFGRVDKDGGGRLLFESLNRAGVEMGCPAPGGERALRAVAQGNEPSWSLRASGSATLLAEPGVTRSAPPVAPSWHWRGDDGRRASAQLSVETESIALRASFTPGLCRDTMADAAYGYRVRVEQSRPAARTLEGCGYLGAPPRF